MSKRFLIIGLITVASYGIFFTTLRHVFLGEAQNEAEITITSEQVSAQSTTTTQLWPPADKPVRLRIPRLEIDTGVQHVGMKENGQMMNPKGFTEVGWYRHGPHPGNQGSAVIAGHLDNGLGLKGVFKNLENIQIGDQVIVEDEEEREIVFEVTELKRYPYDAPSVEVFDQHVLDARLNLITCVGEWIPEKKTYAERLVVFTKRVR